MVCYVQLLGNRYQNKVRGNISYLSKEIQAIAKKIHITTWEALVMSCAVAETRHDDNDINDLYFATYLFLK